MDVFGRDRFGMSLDDLKGHRQGGNDLIGLGEGRDGCGNGRIGRGEPGNNVGEAAGKIVGDLADIIWPDPEMERPFGPGIFRPAPHALAGMIEPGPLPNLVKRHAGCKIGVGRDQLYRLGRRWHLVIISRSPARPGGQIIFGDLPGRQALSEMLGIGVGVCSQRNRLLGGHGHGAMMTVLAGHIEKCGDDDIGLFTAIGANHTLNDQVVLPAFEGVVTVFREPEIVDGIARAEPEPYDIGIDNLCRFFKLVGANHSKRAAALGTERILAALPARRTADDGTHAEPKAHEGKHGVLLVVRMGAGVKHRDARFQPSQGPVECNQS